MEDDFEESLEFMIAMDEVDDQYEEIRRLREDRKRNELLKCIKGKTLSEAKELVFVIKHEMCPFRKLH